jgi:catechol 2,3-dioxygenase-like lactoylglutathione lyase family enzyme
VTDDDAGGKPARRFLHVCYCCSDTGPVTAFLVEGLAMRWVMGTPVERSSGAILGLPDEVEGAADFVYDARGPRTSPAIEVQSWIDPPLTGRPVDDPTAVGIQSLGVSVPDLPLATERLLGLGCTVVGTGRSPFGTDWTTLRDATGVTLDLVADAAVPEDETRMRHLRITCTDLEASLPWYEGMGFAVLATEPLKDATFLGGADAVDAEAARLRLPDEAFEAVLVQWRDPASHGRHTPHPHHAGLYRTAVGVDDTRASYAALTAAGCTFDRAPMPIELRGTPVPDMWICFLSDPDGVPFELVERPRDAFRP